MQTTPKRTARPLIFILLVFVCLLFAIVYLFVAHKNGALAIDSVLESPLRAAGASPLHPENLDLRQTLQQRPYLVRINQTSSSDLGKVELAPLTAGAGPKVVTDLRCERV